MATSKKTVDAVPRDSQRSRVYRAEKMTEHLLVGEPWVDMLDQDEVVELVSYVLEHPSVIARWGHKKVTVEFSRRGQYAWAMRGESRLHFARGASNPLTVMHELAHLLATKNVEAHHGPGFVAIYRYLVTVIMGEDAARILDASFTNLGVKGDDTLLPPVRKRAGVKATSKWEVPGVLSGQMTDAARILRTARDSGLFDDDPELKNAVNRIARRLNTAEKHVPASRGALPILPEAVTINVGSLLRANSRDDVAEIVLSTVRNHLDPKPLRAKPIDDRDPKGKKRKRTVDAQKAAAKRLAAKRSVN